MVYSTTRHVTRIKPVLEKKVGDKFETVLFLPKGTGWRSEGGLRAKGYFKSSLVDKPLITVVTVAFNAELFLEKSILSVIDQSYDNVEYIIIDGGSMDGTLDIIRKYEHAINYWISEPDKGIYDAFNKAVTCASGDWVCFIGADDYLWNPNVLEQMISSSLKTDSSSRLIYGRVAIVNVNYDLLYVVGEPWVSAKRKLKDMMSLPHPGMLHHKTLFEHYGLFDITYRIAGDYEMLLRGWPSEDALFFPHCAVGMMVGGVSSAPRNALEQLRELWRAQRSQGRRIPSRRLIGGVFRVYIRLILLVVLSERSTYRLLDLGRAVMGKAPYWTKTK